MNLDGNAVVVNTEVPAHAANEGTNISFTDPESGEIRTLPLDEYETYRKENGL